MKRTRSSQFPHGAESWLKGMGMSLFPHEADERMKQDSGEPAVPSRSGMRKGCDSPLMEQYEEGDVTPPSRSGHERGSSDPSPRRGGAAVATPPARDARPAGSASCPSLPPLLPPLPLPPGRRTRAPAQAPAAAAMAMRQTPLTCSGHTRPVVDLAFSGVTPYGYFLISACKGERDGPLCSGSPAPGVGVGEPRRS